MRIASLSPAVTEILFALGLHENIVCTDQFSNFPPEAKDIAHVKDHMKVDPSELREYEADLVFTSTPVQQELSQLLTRHGFSVVHQDPRTLHTIYESIRSIGTMFECEKAASDLILSMQQGLNDVKKKAGLLPNKLRVYIEEWPTCAPSGSSVGRPSLPFVAGNWVPEVARFAGVEQYPIPAGELSKEVTLEDVAAFDPDFIVISWCGAGSTADKDLLLQREGWSSLRAVASGDIRLIDDSLLNRPGPRLVDGARHLYGWAFEMLH